MPFVGTKLKSAIRGTKRKAARLSSAKRRLSMSKEILRARIARAEAKVESLNNDLRRLREKQRALEMALFSAKVDLKSIKGKPERDVHRASKKVESLAREISFIKILIQENRRKHSQYQKSIKEARDLL